MALDDLKPLDTTSLCTYCDPQGFPFETTATLDPIELPIGQERARGAVEFAIRTTGSGYNLFAMGPPGLGKQAMVHELISQDAAALDVPPDWCYVNNFSDPQRPRALNLPPGRGTGLRDDMEQLVEELHGALPAAFEGEDYQNRVEELEAELKDRQQQAMQALGEEAETAGIALLHTPTGFAFAPKGTDGNVIKPDDFNALANSEKEKIKKSIEKLQDRLQSVLRQFPIWARDIREKIRELNREVATFAVGHLIEALRESYEDLPAVVDYLHHVELDVVQNFALFRPPGDGERPNHEPRTLSDPLQRYRVNVLVDNGGLDAAPVVYEDLPSLLNLLGRVEHESRMGALITDFTLIRPGALHRANGGFLLLDAHDFLSQMFAWDSLKRALRAGEIRLDIPDRMLQLISTTSLEPEPIPLRVKVVMMGDRRLYYLLQRLDPDVAELFKVVADFEETVDRSPDSHLDFARLCASMAKKHNLRPFDRAAVARFVDRASRIADDSAKLTTHLGDLAELLQEADYWAGSAEREVATGDDVERAVREQEKRLGRIPEHIHESIGDGTLLIDTSGTQVGQVNGLSVAELGRTRFGQPSRITATVRLGDGKLIDIERETELGGPIHSKGVLIIAGYLSAHYGGMTPLSMSASLVFEQSYGLVEGDSASVAELCALLSALSGMPILQSCAVTGSVNQHGRVQPIGGVNEKIEGFFDACRALGPVKNQTVVIPRSNVRNLMLRRDVVQAAEAGDFQVFAVETIDEALSVLTGADAGERNDQGEFPPESVNGRVVSRLAEFASARSAFANSGKTEIRGTERGG